jgi:ribosomal protein S26
VVCIDVVEVVTPVLADATLGVQHVEWAVMRPGELAVTRRGISAQYAVLQCAVHNRLLLLRAHTPKSCHFGYRGCLPVAGD